MTKIIHTMKIKTSTNDSGLTRVVASTPDVDRYGDIVAASWDLAKFEANPVIVWGHDYQVPAIGRAESVQVVGKELIAEIRWDDSEENDLGRLVKSQFQRGFLNSVSVGFQPGKATPRSTLPDDHPAKGASGYFYEQNQLMEISAVNIPANPQALARRAVQADLGVQKHVMEVTEGEDSWTVTFHKYDEAPADEPEEEGAMSPYSDDDEAKISRSEAREIVRDIMIDLLGETVGEEIRENTDETTHKKRTTQEHRGDLDAITNLFGY